LKRESLESQIELYIYQPNLACFQYDPEMAIAFGGPVDPEEGMMITIVSSVTPSTLEILLER
jgi:hypothetical protein